MLKLIYRIGFLMLVVGFLLGAGGGSFQPAQAAPDQQQNLYMPLIMDGFRVGFGAVTGRVIDARSDPNSQEAVPLPNVLVCPLGFTGCVKTDNAGFYTIANLPAGWRRIQASPDTFYEPLIQYASIQTDQTAVLNFALSPELQGDDMRVVLTWNATEKWSVTPEVPNDLDANLWVPADPLPVRIYWDAPYNCESTAFPSACLEFDVQTGYGPETILIQEQRLGVYHYAVFNYGAALAADYGIPQIVPPIQQLGALVQVYDSKGLLQEFRVEEATGAGWWWHVFDIDAVSNPGVLIPVNVVTDEPPAPMLLAQPLGSLDFLRK